MDNIFFNIIITLFHLLDQYGAPVAYMSEASWVFDYRISHFSPNSHSVSGVSLSCVTNAKSLDSGQNIWLYFITLLPISGIIFLSWIQTTSQFHFILTKVLIQWLLQNFVNAMIPRVDIFCTDLNASNGMTAKMNFSSNFNYQSNVLCEMCLWALHIGFSCLKNELETFIG